MTSSVARAVWVAMGIVLAASSSAYAEATDEAAVEPVASGVGEFVGSVALLVDGVMPEEETAWDDTLNVSWSDTTVRFVVDLGSVRTVEHVDLCVDNNDTYAIETSVDGVAFSPLVTVQADSGEVETGIDCFSSDEHHPEYIGAMAFEPVAARFVRIRAVDGDDAYAIGEIRVTSSPPPDAAKGE